MRTLVLLAAVVSAVAVLPATAAVVASSHTAGTLSLRVPLGVLSESIACPPAHAADDCRARTGGSLVPGLGSVSERYIWSYRMGPPGCPAGLGKPLATNALLTVAGKGEIRAAIADGARCIEMDPLRNEPQSFTIDGGTGAFEGASGGGTVERAISAGSGTETWTGTLSVPGLEFDLTRPTITGATSKVVKAKRGAKAARVVFQVTARDDRDGVLAAQCMPRSGSKFQLGRTRVSCSATDSSANTATASFTVTVKRVR